MFRLGSSATLPSRSSPKTTVPTFPTRTASTPTGGANTAGVYCSARPTHEYLGFSAGLDVETKIMVKEDAARLLELEFQKKRWRPQMICLSGNTDCYQSVKRKLLITRTCLDVLRRYRNPVGIITKNALVTRDILRDLAALRLVLEVLSMTTPNAELARIMEPRTSTPELRLAAERTLAEDGILVTVNIAPIIPGLNEGEIPALFKRAAENGARSASDTILRHPGAVEALFLKLLEHEMPGRASTIIARLKDMRGGAIHEGRFGKRMRGGRRRDLGSEIAGARSRERSVSSST